MKPSYIIILIVFLSTGCYENIDNTPQEPEVIIETTEVFVKTRISGNVMNLDMEILNDYYLNINGSTQDIPSDYFLIELEEARKKGQKCKARYKSCKPMIKKESQTKLNRE